MKAPKLRNKAIFSLFEKTLLKNNDFYVREGRDGSSRATYSYLNPEGIGSLFMDSGHSPFVEIFIDKSLLATKPRVVIARYWGANTGAHWTKAWEAPTVEELPLYEIKKICDDECFLHLPSKTKLQKTEEKDLPQFSNAPVEEWEKELTRLYAEAEKNKKIIKVQKEGYLIKYPIGTEEKKEESQLPSWAQKILPIKELGCFPSPWGEVEICPIKWEEEKIEIMRVECPPKPEPIQGFDINRSDLVAEICNKVFGTNWKWGDVNYCSIRDGCKTFEWEDRILKIFPGRYELYKIVEMSKEEIVSFFRDEAKKIQK